MRSKKLVHWFLVAILATAAAHAFAATPLDEAIRLQSDGRNREAQAALRALVPELRGAQSHADLARALTALTDASLALGDYDAAIRDAREAFDLHQQLGQRSDSAWDLNAIGLANFYAGRYDAAIEQYERARAIDREAGDGDGETTRLNNIGNVHFMRGRYSDALRLYEEALKAADTRTSERSRGRLRKMSTSNLAALYQRLGADERALDLYAAMRTGETMTTSEEAQLMLNQGALLRRLGDPVKALATYREAQALFAREQHRDGEIGAWRNVGIVYALDLNDYPKALDAFGAALTLAEKSSNQRGLVQAQLYRSETLRRMGRLTEAEQGLRSALAGAEAVGLVEEQWKALYGLGRVLEATGQRHDAQQSYEKAIAAVESVRAEVRSVALRSEFLADKRDVYDALIALFLAEPSVSSAELFTLVERSRARTWQDRMTPAAPRLALGDVQATIPKDTLLLEYWSSGSETALLWLSSSSSGIAKQEKPGRDFPATTARGAEDWRAASIEAGRALLSGLPDLHGISRLVIVPDGDLHFIPFEALTIPDSRELIVERFDVSYLPSASLLLHRETRTAGHWKWPWERELIAFGNPRATGSDAASLPPLAYADDEVRGIAESLGGKAELHLGADARKAILQQDLHDLPVLHFSTHAVADTRDSERSRILLAPREEGQPADYLYLPEIYEMNLTGVQLVTLSACDTERGKVIRGEGVEGFSRALLAAGASSAVTTMWDVADRSSAEFMKQFYFFLASGESKASALRRAKLEFLHSSLAWSQPRYWAGYVLNGDGTERLPRVIPWSAIVGVPLLIAIAVGAIAYKRRAGSKDPAYVL